VTFKEQQDALVQFIIDNYGACLPAHIPAPEITTEFLDFDKFKGDFTLFVDFEKITIGQSKYADDCSDGESLSVTIYLVRRNNTHAVLQADILDAAWAFYQLVKNKPSMGISVHTAIDGITMYKYVEGTKYLVCSEITLTLDTEL
jgi:hypothetical protein